MGSPRPSSRRTPRSTAGSLGRGRRGPRMNRRPMHPAVDRAVAGPSTAGPLARTITLRIPRSTAQSLGRRRRGPSHELSPYAHRGRPRSRWAVDAGALQEPSPRHPPVVITPRSTAQSLGRRRRGPLQEPSPYASRGRPHSRWAVDGGDPCKTPSARAPPAGRPHSRWAVDGGDPCKTHQPAHDAPRGRPRGRWALAATVVPDEVASVWPVIPREQPGCVLIILSRWVRLLANGANYEALACDEARGGGRVLREMPVSRGMYLFDRVGDGCGKQETIVARGRMG